ncbi:MAG: hypothetical protein ABI162_17725 [Luteolibacter sp.]
MNDWRLVLKLLPSGAKTLGHGAKISGLGPKRKAAEPKRNTLRVDRLCGDRAKRLQTHADEVIRKSPAPNLKGVKSSRYSKMSKKPTPTPNPDTRPPAKSTIPDPPNDGFPPNKDVSTPPPDSDVKTGVHKKEDQ